MRQEWEKTDTPWPGPQDTPRGGPPVFARLWPPPPPWKRPAGLYLRGHSLAFFYVTLCYFDFSTVASAPHSSVNSGTHSQGESGFAVFPFNYL